MSWRDTVTDKTITEKQGETSALVPGIPLTSPEALLVVNPIRSQSMEAWRIWSASTAAHSKRAENQGGDRYYGSTLRSSLQNLGVVSMMGIRGGPLMKPWARMSFLVNGIKI